MALDRTAVEITLKYPIVTVDKDGITKLTLEKLTLRRLKTKDLALLPANFARSGGKLSGADIPKLISAVAGITLEQAGEVDIEDMDVIMNVIDHFFESSPKEE